MKLTSHERMLIQGALVAQLKYHRTLARTAKTPEAIARNTVNAAEVSLLLERFRQGGDP